MAEFIVADRGDVSTLRDTIEGYKKKKKWLLLPALLTSDSETPTSTWSVCSAKRINKKEGPAQHRRCYQPRGGAHAVYWRLIQLNMVMVCQVRLSLLACNLLFFCLHSPCHGPACFPLALSLHSDPPHPPLHPSGCHKGTCFFSLSLLTRIPGAISSFRSPLHHLFFNSVLLLQSCQVYKGAFSRGQSAASHLAFRMWLCPISNQHWLWKTIN